MKNFLFILLLFLTGFDLYGNNIDMSRGRRYVRNEGKKEGYKYVKVNELNFQLDKKTIYELSFPLDLNGTTLTIPDSCYIRFGRKGKLYNGKIKGKLMNDRVSVEQFGAKGNGTFDDTEAIQNAINVSSNIVDFANAKYYLKGMLRISESNLMLRGNGCELFFAPKEQAYPGLYIQSCSNITLSGFKFNSSKGYKQYHNFPRDKGSLWSNRIAISVSKVAGLNVTDCSFHEMEYAMKIDGGVGANKKVYLSNLKTFLDVSNPIYVSNTDSLLVDACIFEASSNVSRFEHHIYGAKNNSNHTIRNCRFIGGSGIPVHYYAEGGGFIRNINISNCDFENTVGMIIISAIQNASMTAKNLTMHSQRNYSHAVIRVNGENSALYISDSEIIAPNQALIDMKGTCCLKMNNVSATIGKFVYTLPRNGGSILIDGSELNITNDDSLIYQPKTKSTTIGKIEIINSQVSIHQEIKDLIQLWDRSSSKILLKSNRIYYNTKNHRNITNYQSIASDNFISNN